METTEENERRTNEAIHRAVMLKPDQARELVADVWIAMDRKKWDAGLLVEIARLLTVAGFSAPTMN